MKEAWKSIRNYEGYYEVSTRGRVRSLDRTISGKFYKGGLKSLYKDKNGYFYVVLTKDMISTKFAVHRLVADAFIPNPDNKREIDHKNTNRSDSRVENLRWVTHKENMNNAITRRRIYIESHKKESTEKAQQTRILNNRKTARKKVYQFSKAGELLHIYQSVSEASKATLVRAQDIASVCRGGRGRRSRGGFLWSYTPSVGKYKPYASKCKKLVQCDMNGNAIKIWDSLSDATNALGISNISRATNPNSCKPIAGGFRWKYL